MTSKKMLWKSNCRALAATVAALFLGFGITLWGVPIPTQKAESAADNTTEASAFDRQIRQFFTRHCLACHGPEKTKGNLRLDKLAPDFAKESNRERWQLILKRVQAGEMPPESKPRPAKKEIQALADWIDKRVQVAEAARKAEGRAVLRRLNRVEYENTVRDLLGIDIELQDLLPLDGSAGGFDNIGEALHVSSFAMEKYLEAADRALNVAIANGPKPNLVKKRYSLKDQHHVKLSMESVYRKTGDTVVLFSSSPWNAVILYQFYPPDRGKYRFRISAAGIQSGGKPVTYRLDAGPMLMATKNHLVGYFDAPADKPAVLEFTRHMEARSTIRILPYGLARAQEVHKIGADKYTGAGLSVEWVETEGPLYETWPPESHRQIFGDLPQTPVRNRERFEVVSKNPEADAERILRTFARRAFRRTVTDDDIKPFLTLFKNRLAKKYSFEQALRVGLLGVMVAPEFLFLRERAGKLDDFALASRLSYFLWSTMPDEELLALAEQKKLGDPKTLRLQVERMLKHPKATAFTENFVGQWLGLRDLDATEPSHILYPEFDDMLNASMLRETHLFWEEVLKNDLSLTNFVSSDFAMLNGRLAKHYGIPGAEGWTFKKVKLPKHSHRGGVLTMASILKVTANGTYTSPILRGAWVLDRILGTPPPRPPEGITAIEPDIRGATTIRQQLAKHRQVASCASCHAKIDPPGFALETFDVIGGWRTHYRTTGNGKPVMLDGRRMPYLQGPKVDPADAMPDGQRFRDIDEFKQLLLKNKDQIARALTKRLVTYATGATVQNSDQPQIEVIVGNIRKHDYGLRTLVHEIVQSELFRNK
jgi:mono/diheme cytochrome c family protein